MNGEEISDALFTQRIDEVLQRDSSAAELTYFEFITLVAFWHFAQERVDALVLEVGLGGRLDATNAATPVVTAITPISFDHMEYLGNTLEAIAGEKAGIFKPGVPAVTSRQPPEALRALREKGPLRLEGEDFELKDGVYRGRSEWRGLDLGLRGQHQNQNAAVALAALESHWTLNEARVREGLRGTRWPGRLEELPGTPRVLLDGAHNLAGVHVLLEALRGEGDVHLVFGVLADKDYQSMIGALFPRCFSVHLAPVDSPRALAPSRYVDEARVLCANVHAHTSVSEALEAARKGCGSRELVLCAGSLVLVGAVKALSLAAPGRAPILS
ncbi:MAG: bifunctional folylpolyglutamate synthase/dihydrofolate synthase [Myxococcaceae bacterium]